VADMTSVPVRILIVDDDPLVRAGLTLMLSGNPDLEILGGVDDGSRVVGAVAEHRPDVVLMDIRMSVVDGVEATELLHQRPDPPKVLILTTFDSDEHVLRALRAGADGFLLKDTPPADLVRAVLSVAAGDAVLSPAVTRRLMELAQDQTPEKSQDERLVTAFKGLTEREREVAISVSLGKSNAEISNDLYISVATVKTHITHLFTKLGVSNRVQMAILVHEARLPEQG
jgi:DNA-binding NarL/FixJ family response regulator